MLKALTQLACGKSTQLLMLFSFIFQVRIYSRFIFSLMANFLWKVKRSKLSKKAQVYTPPKVCGWQSFLTNLKKIKDPNIQWCAKLPCRGLHCSFEKSSKFRIFCTWKQEFKLWQLATPQPPVIVENRIQTLAACNSAAPCGSEMCK